MTPDKPPLNPLPASRQETSSAPAIDQLLQGNPTLWRGCDLAGRGDYGQATGFTELDAMLPGQGWPRNGLMEFITPCWGTGELQLLVPLMRTVAARGQWMLWLSPPYHLYAPALAQAGIDTRQMLVVDLDTSCRDALWTMEKALQNRHCGLVLAWQNWLPGPVLRRLQLAATGGDTLGVLFKHHDSKHSPSALRLHIKSITPAESPLPPGPPAESRPEETHPGVTNHENHEKSHRDANSPKETHHSIEVTLLKARGSFRPLRTRVALPLTPATR